MKKSLLLIFFATIALAGCGNDWYYESDYLNSTTVSDVYGSYSYDDWYARAEDNDIDNFDDCQDQYWTSDAEDGCNEYVKENHEWYNTFGWYECTEDCEWHEAGYARAEENDIDNVDDCDWNSNSFIEWCMAYVEGFYIDVEESTPQVIQRKLSCTDLYWMWATENFDWSCKCRAWYISNNGKCEDADDVCEDILWFLASYNDNTEQCECSYWDVVYNWECMSMDKICSQKFGYSYHYDRVQRACAEY